MILSQVWTILGEWTNNMKTNRKRVPSWAMILVWLLSAVLLGGCGPLVRIEEVLPTAHTTASIMPSTTSTPSSTEPTMPSGPTTPTATPPTGPVPTGPTEPSTPAVTPTSPNPTTPTDPNTSATTRSPGIVVESDEIVPVPDSLVLDFYEALDALIAGVGQWEEPDPAALETP